MRRRHLCQPQQQARFVTKHELINAGLKDCHASQPSGNSFLKRNTKFAQEPQQNSKFLFPPFAGKKEKKKRE